MHFKANGIDLNLTTSKWFICLFVDVLPVEVCFLPSLFQYFYLFIFLYFYILTSDDEIPIGSLF